MIDEKKNHMSLKNKIIFTVMGVLVKVKNMIGIGNENHGYVSKFMGKTHALIAMPIVRSTSLDYIDLIEKNKKLLLKLQN